MFNLSLKNNWSELSFKSMVLLLGIVGLIILEGPVVVGVLMSLTDGNVLTFPPEGISLRWYKELLDPAISGRIHESVFNSLEIAVWTCILTALLTVPAALGMKSKEYRNYLFLEPMFIIPMVLPSIVFGIAALMFASMLGVPTSKWLVVLGHTMIFTPFLYQTTAAIASQLDPALRESSGNLGAHPLYTFRKITLPLILPGVFAGMLLVFMNSLDNVSVSLFLADARTHVLPIRLWTMIEESLDVRVAAISGVIIIVTLIVLLVVNQFSDILKRMSK